MKYLFFFLLTCPIWAQQYTTEYLKMTGWQQLHLKGKVKSLKITSYEAETTDNKQLKALRLAFKYIIKVNYISLVNLIANREVVPELLADRFKISNIANELYKILPLQPGRAAMLEDYRSIRSQLGDEIAPDNAARLIIHRLSEAQMREE